MRIWERYYKKGNWENLLKGNETDTRDLKKMGDLGDRQKKMESGTTGQRKWGKKADTRDKLKKR